MKFLITGANGQLGCSLMRLSSAYPEHDFLFTDLPEADITDRAVMERLIRGSGIEVIVNCAAYTTVDKAEEERETAMRINAEGPAVLAAIAKGAGIGLIHISTDYVFDGYGTEPLKEDDPICPQSVYGLSKANGEREIMASGCDAAIIRTSWLYSRYGSNFVKTMLRLGTEGKALRVVDDQYGTPTYALDLAEAIINIAQRGISGCEVYHYSDEGQTTWFGFAKEIFRQAGIAQEVVPVATAAYPTTAKRPAYSVLSKDKVKALGIPVPEWKESLSECLKEMGYTVEN